jgi:hypothetical protein
MRQILWVVAVGTLLLATGCDAGNRAAAPKTDAWLEPRGQDANCLGDVSGKSDSYDLNQDRLVETFLIMHCKAPNGEPKGDLLEVVLNGADPATTDGTKLLLQQAGRNITKICFADHVVSFRITDRGRTYVLQSRWPDRPSALTLGPTSACD